MNKKLDDFLSHIEYRRSVPIDLSLDRVLKFKEKLKLNPKFKIITIGGTNGKGTTCFYLNKILTQSKLKVGLYTSPHIFRFNERIKINNLDVTSDKILKALKFIDANDVESELTFFEITTLAAIYIFLEEKIDIAILEVGMGGRLDAVNAFNADISAITSIGLDHTDYLGNTVEKIAYEKAGIIRPGKLCFISDLKSKIILKPFYEKLQAIPQIYNQDYLIDQHGFHYKSENIHFPFSITITDLKNQKIKFQNLATAFAIASKILKFSQIDIFKKINYEELISSNYFGRITQISKEPEIIIDVAHNKDSIENLVYFLDNLPKKKTFFVFSLLKDKDLKNILNIFKGSDSYWCLSEIKNNRKLDLSILENIIKEYGFNHFSSHQNCFDSFNYAKDMAKKNDRIVVFGSFYLINECLKGFLHG
ncbi:MAG: folylpolyglutamate synthase/dihydrofolate synthase family protein [Nitrosomonadales bacterium]